MSKECRMCRNDTNGFFIWTSSRYFDRHKFIRILCKLENRKNVIVSSDGEPVCMECVDKYGFMNK